MDYKQARGLLEHHIKTWEGKFPSGHFEACRVGMKALDKQIPKQVGEILGDYENDYDCSICGTVTRFEHQKYCIECGQKLNW